MTEQDFQEFDIAEVVEPTPPAQGETAGFFRERAFEPAYSLQREEPHHRAICILLAQGLTQSEVAEQTGFTSATVAYTKKQPWAQKFIAELQQGQGELAVKAILSGAAAEAARTLAKMAAGELECKPRDRMDASKAILDRLFGSAPQLIKHENVDPSELSNEELRAIATGRSN